jgi:hypothetical protein
MTYFWLKDGQSPWVLSRALDSLQTLLGCISRVQQCLSPRRNWDSPSPESECVPSPEPKGVGTLACEWGGGGFPIPTRRQTLLYSRYVCASSLWMCVPPSPLNSVMSKIMTNLCPWNSENPCKWHPPPPPPHTHSPAWGSGGAPVRTTGEKAWYSVYSVNPTILYLDKPIYVNIIVTIVYVILMWMKKYAKTVHPGNGKQTYI